VISTNDQLNVGLSIWINMYINILWWLVGVSGAGVTLNIIAIVIGITNCQIKYNKMKHNTHIITIMIKKSNIY